MQNNVINVNYIIAYIFFFIITGIGGYATKKLAEMKADKNSYYAH